MQEKQHQAPGQRAWLHGTVASTGEQEGWETKGATAAQPTVLKKSPARLGSALHTLNRFPWKH